MKWPIHGDAIDRYIEKCKKEDWAELERQLLTPKEKEERFPDHPTVKKDDPPSKLLLG